MALRYRLMAQSGYPWTLDLHVVYDVSADGLTVTQSATNRRPTEPAPYAHGAHPYLTVGPGPCDGWELTLPAATRSLSDPERKLPTGREPVDGTEFDFRVARPLRRTVHRPRLHRPGARRLRPAPPSSSATRPPATRSRSGWTPPTRG